MEADSSKWPPSDVYRLCNLINAITANIDPALMNLLKRYFPAEVKAKQRENERNAAIDIYGQDTSGCQIM